MATYSNILAHTKYTLYEAEERFSELKGCGIHQIRVAKRKSNEKRWRYLKRQVPKSSTSIFALSGLWKENREWKGQNTYLNKWWLKTYLLKLWEETDIQTKEAQKILSKIIPKISMPRHIIIKLSEVKDKEKILDAARDK